MYEPKPIDTTGVELPESVLELADLISKNTHDIWAEGRIKEGWTYGPVRDDSLKHHPCLVEYEKLTESEKSYDYNTAIGALKLIVALGYKIVKE